MSDYDLLDGYIQRHGPSCPNFGCLHAHCRFVRQLRRAIDEAVVYREVSEELLHMLDGAGMHALVRQHRSRIEEVIARRTQTQDRQPVS